MNPETHDFCRQCPYYRPVAQYNYQLSNPSKRKCRHLTVCNRVAKVIKASYSGEQLTLPLSKQN